MLLVPVGVDVSMSRWPWMNWVIMAGTVFAFFACWDGDEPTDFLMQCIAGGPHWIGHLLHPLAHFDLMHLIGNMLFLWVFGNAICAKVGNLWFPVVYFGVGLLASLANAVVSGAAGIGASAAINGIVGIFLVWYALNTVNFFWFFWMRSGTFDMPAFWAILMWLAFDIWGAAAGGSRIGHTAHIAGLAVGVAVGIALLKLRLVEMDEDERSILDLLAPKRPQATMVATPRSRSSAAPAASRTARPTSRLPAPSDAPPAPRRGPAPTSMDEPIPLADEPPEKREKRSY
jgi:membrane associated rhomboid family serine protease